MLTPTRLQFSRAHADRPTGLVHVTLTTRSRSGNIISSLVHAHDGATAAAIIITTANAADADGNVLQKMLVTVGDNSVSVTNSVVTV